MKSLCHKRFALNLYLEILPNDQTFDAIDDEYKRN